MCTSPVQPICTFSCTAHFISLHILPLILFHYLFLTSFSPYLYIYIYSLVFLFHSFYCFYVIFILLSCFIFLSCTFHWADLSWLTFHYLLYPVWLCMWQIIKNLEPVEGFAERFTESQKSSQAMRHFLPKHTSSSSASSRPRPAPTQQIAKPTTTALEPQPPEGRRDRERSCSAQCYPFPKRQGPRPKIALDPAPQKSSWTARKKEEGPESRYRCYRWTTAQAASILPLATPLSAGCRGKFVFGSPRAHFSAHVSDLFDSGQNITHIFSKREQKYFSAYHKRPALLQPVFTTV